MTDTNTNERDRPHAGLHNFDPETQFFYPTRLYYEDEEVTDHYHTSIVAGAVEQSRQQLIEMDKLQDAFYQIPTSTSACGIRPLYTATISLTVSPPTNFRQVIPNANTPRSEFEFPIGQDALELLKEKCGQSSCGDFRRRETRLDPSVRNILEIPAERIHNLRWQMSEGRDHHRNFRDVWFGVVNAKGLPRGKKGPSERKESPLDYNLKHMNGPAHILAMISENIRRSLFPGIGPQRDDDRPKLTITLQKLLVYQPGAYIRPHVDTALSPRHVATLVLMLPLRNGVERKGGDLLIEHDHGMCSRSPRCSGLSLEKRATSSTTNTNSSVSLAAAAESSEDVSTRNEPTETSHDNLFHMYSVKRPSDRAMSEKEDQIFWSCFYSSCKYEVTRLETGHRVALQYSVELVEPVTAAQIATTNLTSECSLAMTVARLALRRALCRTLLLSPLVPKWPIGFLLRHQYPLMSVGMDSCLKGSDRILAAEVKQFASVQLRPVVIVRWRHGLRFPLDGTAEERRFREFGGIRSANYHAYVMDWPHLDRHPYRVIDNLLRITGLPENVICTIFDYVDFSEFTFPNSNEEAQTSLLRAAAQNGLRRGATSATPIVQKARINLPSLVNWATPPDVLGVEMSERETDKKYDRDYRDSNRGQYNAHILEYYSVAALIDRQSLSAVKCLKLMLAAPEGTFSPPEKIMIVVRALASDFTSRDESMADIEKLMVSMHLQPGSTDHYQYREAMRCAIDNDMVDVMGVLLRAHPIPSTEAVREMLNLDRSLPYCHAARQRATVIQLSRPMQILLLRHMKVVGLDVKDLVYRYVIEIVGNLLVSFDHCLMVLFSLHTRYRFFFYILIRYFIGRVERTRALIVTKKTHYCLVA